MSSSSLKQGYRNAKTRGSLRSRLLAEELESRCVPAVYYWAGQKDNADWFHVYANGGVTNWRTLVDGRWDFSTGFPGPNDEAIFQGKDPSGYVSTQACVLPEKSPVILKRLAVLPGYTNTLTLKSSVTVTGAFTFSSGSIIRGSQAGQQTLIDLGNNSSFLWKAGSLASVDLRVGGVGAIAGNSADSLLMNGSSITVSGSMDWTGGNVRVNKEAGISKLTIAPGANFNITADGGIWNADSQDGKVKANTDAFQLTNFGTVRVESSSTATINGNYTTVGTTTLNAGVFAIGGAAEQSGNKSAFQILSGSIVKVVGGTKTLGIRDGTILGDGKVIGSLELGNNPDDAGYKNAPRTNPIISPGGGAKDQNVIGTIEVTEFFKMFCGDMLIDLDDAYTGADNDKVKVGKDATVCPGVGTLNKSLGGKAVLRLIAGHKGILPGAKVEFLFYDNLVPFAAFREYAAPPDWIAVFDDKKYWFEYKGKDAIPADKEKVGGNVWRDDGGVAGVFEPGEENGIEGVTVTLLGADGETTLATTATDSNGNYEFTDLNAGLYFISFERPEGDRFAAQNMTTDDLDSDPDPTTGLVSITLANDVEDVSAGLYSNADPIAVDDEFHAHKNTAISGEVLSNDSDEDGDQLALSLDSDVSHGTLTLNSDGTFSYTPDTDWTGTDSFTYLIEDDFEGSDTATVDIVVANTLAPVGVADEYFSPGDLLVEAEAGVLDNDTDQDNGDLLAVLVSGPTHGTLYLGEDGAFSYFPDSTFVGTDSFTYCPTDDDGPGEATTVSIHITDNPPTPEDDEEATDEDTPVSIYVLANDTDPDEDELSIFSAGDGLGGTVAIDDNNTEEDTTDDFLVYTPNHGWNGEDSFVYGVADEDGRVTYATVTVTVESMPSAPVTADDTAGVLTDTETEIDVLANDYDPDGDTLIVSAVTNGAHGTVAITVGAGAVTYTPDSNFTGVDTFTYTASDGNGGTTVGTVRVAVSDTGDVGAVRLDEPFYVNSMSSSNDGSSGAISLGFSPEFFGTSYSQAYINNNGSITFGSALSTATSTVLTSATLPMLAAFWADVDTRSAGTVFYGTGTVDEHDAFAATWFDVGYYDQNPDLQNRFQIVLIDRSDIDTGVFDVEYNYDHVNWETGDGSGGTDGLGGYSARVGYADGSSAAFELEGSGENGALLDAGVNSLPTHSLNSDVLGRYIFSFNGGAPAPNSPPEVTADSDSTNEDTPVEIDVLANDSDPDSDDIAVASVTQGAHGTVTITEGGVTYTPDANWSGSDSFSYSVEDGNGGLGLATVSVTVYPVNDPPAVYGATLTTSEDTAVDVDLRTLAFDLETATENLTFSVDNGSNGTVSLLGDGYTARFTPTTSYHGWADFTYTATDTGDGASAAITTDATTVSIMVNAAPDPSDDEEETDEDTPVDVLVLLNDSDADSDDIWIIGVSNGDHGTTAVDDNATSTDPSDDFITYTPDANWNGEDSFTYEVEDGFGGVAYATVTVTVNSVNDIPAFTKGSNQTVNEDASAQTVTGWATSISAGPSNESGQTLTFHVSNNNNSLFSAQPVIDSSGNLTYTLATNANGSATVSVYLQDNSGTANGGQDTSATQTFTITATPVNDAPSFTKGSNQTVNEDASAQTVTGWATSISAGPTDENEQTLTFNVSNDNTSLFSSQPAIDSSGNLTYTLAANANGSATVSVSLQDNGGTANGGQDTSATQTFTITATPVNDAPSFTKGANQTVSEDSGSQTVTGWATNLSTGPSDESEQTLTFHVSNNNTSLFSSQPSINASGNLTYTLATNANGSATVSVYLQDNGGTANSGQDTSATQTFTITATPVNDAPSFTKGSNQTVNEDASAQTVTGWATSISPGPTDENEQTLTFNVSNDNTSLFSGQPAIDSSGNLTYTLAANANGSATVSVSLQDNGGTANGGQDTSATQTFTITATPVNDAPVASDASRTTPRNTAVDVDLRTLVADVETADNNLTFAVSGASNGTVTLLGDGYTARFTPSSSYHGSASFTYTATDTGDGASAAITTSATTVTVSVNSIPTASNGTITTHAGDAADLYPSTSDADGDMLTLSIASQGSHGTASIIMGGMGLRYTPSNSTYTGTDTFTYQVSDGYGGTATATVTVTLTNTAPVAYDDSATVHSGASTTRTPMYFDADGDTVTVSSYTQGNHGGTVTTNSMGGFVYTASSTYTGTETFSYTVSDGHGGTDTGVITITVTNAAPVAYDSSTSTSKNMAVNISPMSYDADADTLTLTYSQGSHGSVSYSAGMLRYTPNTDFTGTDTITFTVNDGHGEEDTGTITITVYNM